METATQLTKFNDEIDAVSKNIDTATTKWENEVNPDKATIYLDSIKDWKVEKRGLIATRDRIIDAALAAASSSGKNAPSRPRR